VVIDEGAVAALTANGRSLLAVGVRRVEGDFRTGSAVEIIALDGGFVGKGLARMSSAELIAALGDGGVEQGQVVVHRDDLVVMLED
jgi:glutamate 5-kinase